MKVVIKVGGALFAQGIDNVIKDLKALVNEYQFIIVHGGGPQINDLGSRLGKEAQIYTTPLGMKTRYTNKEQMDIVKMALGGYINKTIVESLRKVGINAFGFSGLDGGTIIAERKEQIYVVNEQGKRVILHGEFSGKVSHVDPTIINLLLEKHYLPVIACISSSLEGDAVNVDGDRSAIAIASALNADKFISLTDVEGVYKNMETKEVIPRMTKHEAELFMEKITGGMKKKIFAALEGLNSNISEFIIYSGSATTPISDIIKGKKGTVISK